MKIALHQLKTQLTKSLAAIYLLCGEEILLQEEAAASIRSAAKEKGFDERTRVSTENNSDWSNILYYELQAYSLFSRKRILEIDLCNIKLNAAQSKLLQEIAAQSFDHHILIIRLPKLDAKLEQSAWFKAFDKKAVVVQIWPIQTDQLASWIITRAQLQGLEMTKTAAELLAQRCESNLLAASQEIEKLRLLDIKKIDDALILENSYDASQFNIFSLVECAIGGDKVRLLRILNHLQHEKIETTLVIWALTRELRLLYDIAILVQKGESLQTAFSKYHIWEKRKLPMQVFLKNHSLKSCLVLLKQAAKIDSMIKGVQPGNVWDALRLFVLRIAGQRILAMRST